MKESFLIQSVYWVFEPEFHRYEVLKFAQAAFHPPAGCSAFRDQVLYLIGKLQLDHVQLRIRIPGKHTAAGSAIHSPLGSLGTLGVMMTVNR